MHATACHHEDDYIIVCRYTVEATFFAYNTTQCIGL